MDQNRNTNGGSAPSQQGLRDSGIDKRFQVMNKERFMVGLNPGQFLQPRLGNSQGARPRQVLNKEDVDQRKDVETARAVWG